MILLSGSARLISAGLCSSAVIWQIGWLDDLGRPHSQLEYIGSPPHGLSFSSHHLGLIYTVVSARKQAPVLKRYSSLCIMVSNVPLAKASHKPSPDLRCKVASTSIPYCFYLGYGEQERAEIMTSRGKRLNNTIYFPTRSQVPNIPPLKTHSAVLSIAHPSCPC